jgi:hypothetical protein
MSEHYLNQNTNSLASKNEAPNYQSILSKNGSYNQKNLFRSPAVSGNNYLSFAERVEQSPYLISFEQQSNLKKNKKSKKKEINSYISNKDKLFIPKPERVHQGIDIYKNLVEEEKKIVTADLGIQSDEIDYTEKEKIFIPQKLGKDIGTQILDGELFNFDRDVQPLLTVVVGKTLEQSLLEIEQEDEIANLREAKLMYIKKKNDNDKRIKNLEDREIQKKYNNDAKKENRKKNREIRKTTQKELISRVISKKYLRDLLTNAYTDLIHRGQFKNYTSISVKNKTNNILMSGSQKLNKAFTNMKNYLQDKIKNKYKDIENSHQKSVEKRHELLAEIARQKEIKRKREEDEKIRAEEAKKERRKKRKIERIKKEIKTTIIDNGIQKGEAYSEEMVEIGNFNKDDEPYIGVYGSVMGMLVVTLSMVQRDCFQDEVLYTVDNISEIMRMFFDEAQCTLTLHFNEEAANEVVKVIQNSNIKEGEEEEENPPPDIELTDLRNQTDLSAETWNKIGDVLENIEYNNDMYFKYFIEDFSKTFNDKEGNETIPIIKDDSMYKLIIRCIIDMCIKSIYTDHFKLLFDKEKEEEEEEKKEEGEEKENEEEEEKENAPKKEVSFADLLNKYEAICMLEWEKSTSEIINQCEYVRPSKKKSVPAPDLENDFIQLKAYQNNPETHNVLLYDRIAEFCIRNKMFECALAHYSYITGMENDSSEMFKTFNMLYDEVIDNSEISNTIQVYHYAPEKEKANEAEEEEE